MPDEHSRTSGQHWSHQSHASQHTSSHTSDELPALPEQLPAAISPCGWSWPTTTPSYEPG